MDTLLPLGYDFSDFLWNMIGFVAVGVLIWLFYNYFQADAEKKRADSLFLPREEQKTPPNFLDQIESESIYCGAPETTKRVVMNDLYKAAKRARKDKALTREIRMELDKAINQYENANI